MFTHTGSRRSSPPKQNRACVRPSNTMNVGMPQRLHVLLRFGQAPPRIGTKEKKSLRSSRYRWGCSILYTAPGPLVPWSSEWHDKHTHYKARPFALFLEDGHHVYQIVPMIQRSTLTESPLMEKAHRSQLGRVKSNDLGGGPSHTREKDRVQ
jgi:hypothetical protein